MSDNESSPNTKEKWSHTVQLFANNMDKIKQRQEEWDAWLDR